MGKGEVWAGLARIRELEEEVRRLKKLLALRGKEEEKQGAGR